MEQEAEQHRADRHKEGRRGAHVGGGVSLVEGD